MGNEQFAMDNGEFALDKWQIAFGGQIGMG
jgi:hypothetical protein